MNVEIILSIIVGILSIFVTALICWQIFAILDINKIRKDIREQKKIVVLESERNMCSSAMSLADFYYNSLTEKI